MKSLGNAAVLGALALLLVAAVAPSLIAVSNALVPLVIVLAIAAVVVRLVFFHTRNW